MLLDGYLGRPDPGITQPHKVQELRNPSDGSKRADCELLGFHLFYFWLSVNHLEGHRLLIGKFEVV